MIFFSKKNTCVNFKIVRRLGEPYLLANRALLAQLSAGNGRVESPEVGPLPFKVRSGAMTWRVEVFTSGMFVAFYACEDWCRIQSPKLKYSKCVPRPRSQTTSGKKKKKHWQVAGEAPVEEFQQTAKLVEQEVAPEGSEMQAFFVVVEKLHPKVGWCFSENKNRWF